MLHQVSEGDNILHLTTAHVLTVFQAVEDKYASQKRIQMALCGQILELQAQLDTARKQQTTGNVVYMVITHHHCTKNI